MFNLKALSTSLALGLAITLAACQSGTPTASISRADTGEAQTSRAPAAYSLGVGDQVKITVFGQPDLSGQFEIDGTGSISMPLIGQVSAINQSTSALETTITTRLADGFLREPRVSAEVANYRPYYILGEVGAPGEYPFASGLSVVNAVAAAGGFTYRANKKTIYIKSIDADSEAAFLLNSQVLVQPGDTIRVGERLF